MPATMVSAAIYAMMFGSALMEGESFNNQLQGACIESWALVASAVASLRLIEKIQHEAWLDWSEAGMPVDFIDYGFLGVQFIPESQLDEEALDLRTERVYVIPDGLVRYES